MFINFDNSEDAFFPDNDTVRLLNDVEDDYQASIDFIRFIDDIDENGRGICDACDRMGFQHHLCLLPP